MAYWPWWLGAVGLSSVMLGYVATTGRVLGISGLIARVVAFTTEVEFDRIRARNEVDPDACQAALLAATREQFGNECDEGEKPPSRGQFESLAPSAPPTRVTSDLVFLGMTIGGGALASAVEGSPGIQFSLGDEFTALIGSGWRAAAALLLGGLLIGFGTRMAGGCTTGHGLAGCARLQPGSLLATLAFFGAAAITSFALAGGGG